MNPAPDPMPHPDPTADPGRRRPIAWPPVVVVLGAGAAALLARHGLVEPAEWIARCTAAPWEGLACTARSLLVQAFVHHRLAIMAAVVAGLGWGLRRAGLSLVGLGLGVAGLVLYGASVAAPAALVGLLGWVRASTPAGEPGSTPRPAVTRR